MSLHYTPEDKTRLNTGQAQAKSALNLIWMGNEQKTDRSGLVV